MVVRTSVLVLTVALALSACNRSPTGPTLPWGERPLPPDNPPNETYSIVAGYISTSQGRIQIPEGGIHIRIIKIQPGRGSVLIFDSPGQSSVAGIDFELTTSADMPDFFYWLMFKLVDEAGNELPTHWMEGGTNGPPPDGIRPNHSYRIPYKVPVDSLRNIPLHVPTLRIKYPWGKNFGDFSGYLMDSNGFEIQTTLSPYLNWHTQQ